MTDQAQGVEEAKAAWDHVAKLTAVRELAGAVAPPESQFSLNWQMVDGYGGNVQVTMRAAFIGEWPDIMRERKEFCEKAQTAGWTFPGKVTPNAVAPALPPSPKGGLTGSNGAPVPPPLGVVAPAAGRTDSVCAMIEVATSYSGGKTQLKFHVDGMEHPLTFTREVKEMATLLKPLGYTADHIVVGKKYPTNCIVTWVQAEKYRNVLAVRPA
jgi:hypothetical protein